MSRNLLIVANPYSGTKKTVETTIGFKEYLDGLDVAYDFYYTAKQKDGKATVEQYLQKNHTDLVILGGDGTVNECVNGLGDKDLPITIIPTGTGNDFSKMLNLPKKRKDQFHLALNGDLKRIDAGICNERIFMNGVGIGFDGEIVKEMLQNKTILSGQSAYYYHVLRILSTYKERHFEFSLDGEEFQKDLILLTVAKGTTFGGGFKLTPNAQPDDGFLDVCEIAKLSPAKRYLNVLRLQNGTHNSLKAVNLYKVKSVTLDANPLLNTHIDGEFLGNPPFEINVLPGRFEVRVG